jgi:hopene-associated glycosyltransferase HpnB
MHAGRSAGGIGVSGLMIVAVAALAAISLAAWLGLLLFRGGFWRADQRLGNAGDLAFWPPVTAVIPARDEAATIGATVQSLLQQDYDGDVRVIVVDDNSEDGTACAAGTSDRLRVIVGKPLIEGWTGKLWAVSQGVDAIEDAAYVLLTDADIVHHPGNLKRLIYKAETDACHLVSLMVKLRCESFWERWLIPAFVFFFQKLYPFPTVNKPAKKIAAAAGGCMLVRRDTLANAGGIKAIGDQLIDDCALARLIKPHGAIWLGLATRTHSLRAYQTLGEIWNMVARTAYVQLDHSLLALLGTVLGMAVIYLMPPLAVIIGVFVGDGGILAAGGLAWAVMALAYTPTLALYGFSPVRALALPVAAGLYTLMTLSSALRHRQGRGGAWKGRFYGSDE